MGLGVAVIICKDPLSGHLLYCTSRGDFWGFVGLGFGLVIRKPEN